MLKRILISAFVAFTLFSCSLDDDGSNFSIETLTIKEAVVPSDFVYGASYTITVTYELPGGCYSFYDLFYRYEGTSRIVAINAIVNTSPNVACTDDIREAEHSFEVRVSQRENYTFRFWKGKDADGQDIFEDIVVPVNDQ